jgi:cytochrome b pre-mRNA-processing protein 3
MNYNYLTIYNNFIKLTTNKKLYRNLKKEDTFSDRLTLFLLHFAFFLKNFKDKEDKKLLQQIYDFNFRQLELSIREIGYGDQTINKKMKEYLNLFHSIVSEIHFWNKLEIFEKNKKISIYFENYENIDYLIEYFDNFNDDLSKMTLNSYIKSVNNV